jgi:predicted acyltransferase
MADLSKPLPATLNPAPRLVSLDALRGFDMCWILGLDAVVTKVARIWPDNRYAQIAVTQLDHVAWEGFRFYDLIFPLFLFLSGVSMSISVARRKERDGAVAAAFHLLYRGIVLFLIGVIYSGGLQKFTGEWRPALDQVRWMGVLQRIAIGSMFAGLLSIWLGTRGLFVALVVLLGGYWAMMLFIPVPEFGAGNFEEGKNLANYVDIRWLPGRKYDGQWDPEGLLSNLPAIGTAILGILSGKWLFSTVGNGKKVAGLIIVGAIVAAAGWGWGLYFPVVKKIWTSSFVLLAGGCSMMLLGLFYGIIDGIGLKMWAAPFVWVGANPIALYLASGLGFFRTVSSRLVGAPADVKYAWIPNLVSFLLMLAVARWLYRRNIHIRI